MKKSRVIFLIIILLSIFFLNISTAKAETAKEIETRLRKQYEEEYNSCVKNDCDPKVAGSNTNSCVEGCAKAKNSKIDAISIHVKEEQLKNKMEECITACDPTVVGSSTNSCIQACGKNYENSLNKLHNPTNNSKSKKSTGSNAFATFDSEVCDEGTLYIFQILVYAVRLIQIVAPFALIIWGSLDFFKALIAGDEKAMKEKRKPFIGRILAAALIIILPIIVNFIVQTVSKDSANEFLNCWVKASNKKELVIPGFGD